MSVTSFIAYVLLCVYYASRTTLIFFVEIIFFLPFYYFVERHDIPSVWLGRRGEAQVQPVHLAAPYLTKNSREHDVLNGSDTIGVMEVSAGVELRSDITRKAVDSVCVVSRKAIRRIQSLRTEERSSWWWPQVGRCRDPLSPTPSSEAPHQRQQQPRHPIPRSSNNRPWLSVTQSRHDVSLDDSDSAMATNGPCPQDGKKTMPREKALQRHPTSTPKFSVGREASPADLTTTATTPLSTLVRPRALSVGASALDITPLLSSETYTGSVLMPIDPPSTTTQTSEAMQWLQSPQRRLVGCDFLEKDVSCTSFMELLSGSAREVVDGDHQFPSVTDAFFRDVDLNVLHSAEALQRHGYLPASLHGRGGLAQVKGFVSPHGSHPQSKAVPRRVSPSSGPVERSIGALQDYICATVPAWCNVVVQPIPLRQSATHGDPISSSSAYVRGQYGFLPPWYAVHARAQLLLALADPLLRIAAEVMCCRGWVTSAKCSPEQMESSQNKGANTVGSVTAACVGEGPRSPDNTRAISSPALTVHPPRQSITAFFLGPIFLCFRILRDLVYLAMHHFRAVGPHRDTPCMHFASPFAAGTSSTDGGLHILRRLKCKVKAQVHRYTMDTQHSFETLRTEELAQTTVSPVAATKHLGGSITLPQHGLSGMTTSRVRVPGAARSRDHATSLSPPLSSAMPCAPPCRRSVGVCWLHGRRPPMWSAAPPGNRCTTSPSHLPSPTTASAVVVLLLCPSLLQGSGLYPHTVTRLSHLCQLLTLVGAWQSGLATDTTTTTTAPGGDGDGDGGGPPRPCRGDFLMKTSTMTNAAQSRDNSTRIDLLSSNIAPGKKKTCAAANPCASINSSKGIPFAGSDDNYQAPPQDSHHAVPPVTSCSLYPAVQWYAAVPVVELRAPATSQDGDDDVSMPPLTLRDLRQVVGLLRRKLELGPAPPENVSDPFSSAAVGDANFPSSHDQSFAKGASAEIPGFQAPTRQVYIVAVGWSEAASPLLELAITQQQQQQHQTPTSNGIKSGGGSPSAQPPAARLDGVVCLSHTLSSTFQLLPQQHAQTVVLEHTAVSSPLLTSPFAQVSRRRAADTGGDGSSGGTSSPINSSLSAPSPMASRLHASLHMPRILSRLTTGPARLLLLLTRMQLIADALLSHRQHQEWVHRGGKEMLTPVRTPEASGVCWPPGMPISTPPKAKTHRRPGASWKGVGCPEPPGISFYHILHLFREAREEVNRAQSGLNRASVTWIHHQQRQHQQQSLTQSVHRRAGVNMSFFTSMGSLSAVMSSVPDRRVELGTTRGATRGQHVHSILSPATTVSLSSVSAGATRFPGTTTNGLAQHNPHFVPVSKFARHLPCLGSLPSAPLGTPLSNAASPKVFAGASVRASPRRDHGNESHANIPVTLSSCGGGGLMLSSWRSDQGPVPSHEQPQSLSRGYLDSCALPIAMPPDHLQDTSVSWALPRLETAMDWEELAQSPLMTKVQQQQRLEVANATANDLPSLLSANNVTLVSSSGSPRRIRSTSRFEGETIWFTANGSTATAPSSVVGNRHHVSRLHMSTDDVIASCTLQVVSPTHRPAVHFPGKEGTTVAVSPAVTPHSAPPPSYREWCSDTVDENTFVSAGDGACSASSVAVPLMQSTGFCTALESDRDSSEDTSADVFSGSENPCSEQFGSFDAPPVLSLTNSQLVSRADATQAFMPFTPTVDGNTSELCAAGAEGEQGATPSSSGQPASKGSVLPCPAKPATPARSPASRSNPPSISPQLESTVAMPHLEDQNPIPYPAPSRVSALSPQTAALVELRVRSAQHAALVQRITVPTLLIHARDDPVAPISTVPFTLLQANPWITTVLTRRGSHAVFMEGVSEVWRRPRLVLTERVCPADTGRPLHSTGAAAERGYWPGRVFDDVCIGSSAQIKPRRGSLSVSSNGGRSNTQPLPPAFPAMTTSPGASAVGVAAQTHGLSSSPQERSSNLSGSGHKKNFSFVQFSNSSSSEDFATDESDSDDGGVVEWLHEDRKSDVNGSAGMHQVASPRSQGRQQPPPQQQKYAAAAVSSQWQARIDGTTWLERVIFEYVERVILCPAGTSTSPSASASRIV